MVSANMCSLWRRSCERGSCAPQLTPSRSRWIDDKVNFLDASSGCKRVTRAPHGDTNPSTLVIPINVSHPRVRGPSARSPGRQAGLPPLVISSLRSPPRACAVLSVPAPLPPPGSCPPQARASSSCVRELPSYHPMAQARASSSCCRLCSHRPSSTEWSTAPAGSRLRSCEG
jgi:hypothetical protein